MILGIPPRRNCVRSPGRAGPAPSGKPAKEILGEGKDSEASDAIIRVVDRPDPRPVWVCVWGGSREVAQAIWKVQATRSPAELERFLGKLRIYLIAKQDGTTQWLLDKFPSLFVILSEKNYMGMFWNMHGSDPKLADLAWINANIRQGHGPLGAAYPQSGWNPKNPGQQEGDTPSFLHLVSAVRGLNDPEKPDQAGWGGQFVRRDPSRNHWFDDPAGTQTVSRWRAEVQAGFRPSRGLDERPHSPDHGNPWAAGPPRSAVLTPPENPLPLVAGCCSQNRGPDGNCNMATRKFDTANSTRCSTSGRRRETRSCTCSHCACVAEREVPLRVRRQDRVGHVTMVCRTSDFWRERH